MCPSIGLVIAQLFSDLKKPNPVTITSANAEQQAQTQAPLLGERRPRWVYEADEPGKRVLKKGDEDRDERRLQRGEVNTMRTGGSW